MTHATSRIRRAGIAARALAAALALFSIAGCGGSESHPNVLLITLDTTRADHLGCYGYGEATTPTLDALAADGVRFERAYSHVPLTLPSHASLFTGTYPRVHGVPINGAMRLGDRLPTLAERFRERGYRTGAFVSAWVVRRIFGLDRGFDHYDDAFEGRADEVRSDNERPANEVGDAALAWLEQPADRPFFAWVHFFDPHDPYQPPAEYRERFAHPYDGELAFVDAQVRRLIHWLEERNLRDKTLIVVAGDHGESLGEHNEPEHGLFVYDTTMRVPLILSWPSAIESGRVVADDVQLVDLYPTLLDLLAFSGDDAVDGTSLVPLIEGRTQPARPIYGESLYGQLAYGWGPLRFLIDERWKFIEAPQPELYDREADPREGRNLIDREADVAARMRARLIELEEKHPPVEGEAADLDGQALARLQSLGYVGLNQTPSALPEDLSSLRDPKDMLEVYRGHFRSRELLKRFRYAEAARLLEQLVGRSPESVALYEDLGFAYLSTNRIPEAQQAYEKSLTNIPDHPDRLWGLAESLRRQNKLEDAVAIFRQSLAGRPDLPATHMGLTLAYAGLGRYEEAYASGRRHLELEPESARAQGNLANVCMALGRFDEAYDLAEQLLAGNPESREAHYVQWEALHGAGRTAEAIEALRRSREHFPEDWYIDCALAWLLAITPPQSEEAIEESLRLARRAVELDPRHPRSHDTLAAALAAGGDFGGARQAARRARELARGPELAPLKAEIDKRLRLYEAGEVYRE